MKCTKILYVATCGIFFSLAAQAQNDNNMRDQTTDHASDTVKSEHSDNTAVNTRDRNTEERTADQAKNNLPDREVMQRIRKSVMSDKSLSTYAHNVKIIAEHGKVTLKGPVRSDAERKTIEDKATEVVGAGNVTNEISIKGHNHHS